MLSFERYLTERRFTSSNLPREGWDFVVFALGRPEYLKVTSWP